MPNSVSPKKEKVLIVDDFSLFRSVVVKALEAIGCTDFMEAQNAKVALEKLNREFDRGAPFTLIITDWNMPGMNGYEFIQACRASQKFSKIPILMLTAEADQNMALKAIRGGATSYITKPIDQPTLESKLTKIISNHQKKTAA